MFTIFGANGFIGSHLTRHLQSTGRVVTPALRGEWTAANRDLGHVVFCVGVTADFRGRPLETLRAHVSALVQLLEVGTFESLLYLSSTRVYQGGRATTEDTELRVNPNDPSDLYNISKLAGEAACLALRRPTVRVARLSNVYGPDALSKNFLPSVIRDALRQGKVELGTAVSSCKDYVAIDDVVGGLTDIALRGSKRLYNLASGQNVTHGEILERLVQLTGCKVEVRPGSPATTFPEIDVTRMRDEFDYRPPGLLDRLEDLVAEYRRMLEVS